MTDRRMDGHFIQAAVTPLKVVTEIWFLYQYGRFHFIPFYTFRDMLWTRLLLKKMKRARNSVHTGDRVTVLSFCYSPISVSSFIKLPLIILEIRYGQKCEGRTVKQTKRQLYALPSGSIKIMLW